VCLLNIHNSGTGALHAFILIQIQLFDRLGSVLIQFHDYVKLLGGLVAID